MKKYNILRKSLFLIMGLFLIIFSLLSSYLAYILNYKGIKFYDIFIIALTIVLLFFLGFIFLILSFADVLRKNRVVVISSFIVGFIIGISTLGIPFGGIKETYPFFVVYFNISGCDELNCLLLTAILGGLIFGFILAIFNSYAFSNKLVKSNYLVTLLSFLVGFLIGFSTLGYPFQLIEIINPIFEKYFQFVSCGGKDCLVHAGILTGLIFGFILASVSLYIRTRRKDE